jgi:hypothetical protein
MVSVCLQVAQAVKLSHKKKKKENLRRLRPPTISPPTQCPWEAVSVKFISVTYGAANERENCAEVQDRPTRRQYHERARSRERFGWPRCLRAVDISVIPSRVANDGVVWHSILCISYGRTTQRWVVFNLFLVCFAAAKSDDQTAGPQVQVRAAFSLPRYPRY